MPLDVIQKVPGHGSLQTPSIDVHAKQQRMVSEIGQYYAQLAREDVPPL